LGDEEEWDKFPKSKGDCCGGKCSLAWTSSVIISILFLVSVLGVTFYVFYEHSEIFPEPPVVDVTTQFSMIPTRDGVSLATWIYRPKKLYLNEELPFLFVRTPYSANRTGVRPNGEEVDVLLQMFRHLIEDGYIFVAQDVRGKGYSQGIYDMLAPPCPNDNKTCTDDATDQYDSIEWLVNNIPHNNGRVGTSGISYMAFTSVMGLMKPHPALKAASPQASPADVWRGDDFFTNGAMRLSVAFGYAALMQSGPMGHPFVYDKSDTFDFFMNIIPLSLVNQKYFTEPNDRKPLWDELINNPNYNEHWQKRDLTQYLPKSNTVATMLVDGWFDAEDFYGIFAFYDKMMTLPGSNLVSLVVGPWYHGQWVNPYMDGRTIGRIQFDSDTAVYFRELHRSFFWDHLRKPTLPVDYVPPNPAPQPWNLDGKSHIFTTGANTWSTFDHWPVLKSTSTPYYLSGTKGIGTQAPTVEDAAPRCYTADPLRPIPYVPRPIKEFWKDDNAKFLWKLLDQRGIDHRPDIVSWSTTPLQAPITIQGNIKMKLFASTTGTDLDWIVKLINKYPEDYTDPTLEGYELPVADMVVRAKFRDDPVNPTPLEPGKVTEFTIDLLTRSHTFLKGHSMIIQISSSLFPLHDPNPQTFVNIPNATIDDYKIATHCIYFNKQYPSHIQLPIVVA